MTNIEILTDYASGEMTLNEMFMSMLNGFNQLRSMLNEFFNSTDSEKKVHELYDNK